jgi:O-antigen ligase
VTLAAEPAVPRADAPHGARVFGGFFAFGSTSLRGLPVAFWLLMGYLLVGLSAADEEWEAVGRLRPRLLLGGAALVVATFVALRAGLAAERGPVIPWPVARWLAAFAVVGSLATVWAFDTSLAIPAWLDHVTALLAFPLLVVLVRTRREVLVTVLVFCAGSGVYLLRSFQEWLNGKIDVTMGVHRMMGAGRAYADPNSFAATVVYAMPLVIWAGIHTRSALLRVCAVAYGLLGAFCVVQAHSRSGLVLLSLTFVWTLFALPGRRSRAMLLATATLLGAFVVSGLSENAVERFTGIFSTQTYQEDESTRGRIEGYRVAFRIARDNPALGIGPGNWSAYRVKRVDGDPLLPHNLIGQVLASFGVLGTIAFFGYVAAAAILLFGIVRGRRGSPDPWDRAVASLAGSMAFVLALLLVAGLAAHNVGREAWAWAPALALAAATARREDESVEPGVDGPASPADDEPNGR